MAKNAKTTAVDRGFAIRIWEFAGVFTDLPGNHAKWRCNWSATNQLLKTDHLGNGWFQSVQGIVTKHGQCVFVEMEPSTQTVPLQSTVAFRQYHLPNLVIPNSQIGLKLILTTSSVVMQVILGGAIWTHGMRIHLN